MRRPYVQNRDLALFLGLGAWLLGTLLLRDAFENRGRPRPLGLRALGGVL